ncbi:hypothetical protein SCHPADRAFT_1000918 [Schizopora paradoxa]|uniref:F-box domain-containing protein n=1 Tax=Schizopora paradoxa TaxID=27342 RepID=A0A0H2RAP1_9AGAM|nr:hypothetical protein SCHPADRAFT_1000918 [Schizopora paradoxa]
MRRTGVKLALMRALEMASAGTYSEEEDYSFDLSDWCFAKTFEKLQPSSMNSSNLASDLLSEWAQVESMLKLSKALVASTSVLLNLYDRQLRCLSSKLSKGLTSLPDELLVYILRFAQGGESAFKDALSFSHVSRRFRRLTVGNRVFWSTVTLSRNSEKERIDFQLSRGGKDARIHVTFEFDEMYWNPEEFFDTFSETAAHWQFLTIKGKFYEGDQGTTIFDKVLDLFEYRHIVLPQLQEMCLEEEQLQERPDVESYEDVSDEDIYERCWYSCDTKFKSARAWNLPNLRTLKCIQCAPSPSFPFNSITTLDMTLHILSDAYANQIVEMKRFIASSPSITEITLTLFGYAASGRVEHDFDFKPVICPNVTSFKIHVAHFEKFNLIISTINSLRMPKLRSFEIFDEGYSGWESKHQKPFLIAPNPIDHRLLESFTVNIRDTNGRDSKPQLLVIPLEALPNVSSLCVTTSGGSVLRRSSSPSEGASSLRELQFKSCEKLDFKHLSCAVFYLKEAGVWETLKHLVVQDCKLLDYEAALKAVGIERLRFLTD